MSKRVPPAPIKQSIVVEAPIERAFKVFTEDFGSFKPTRAHSALPSPSQRPCSSLGSEDTSVIGVSTAANAAGRVCWPLNRQIALLLSWDISPRWQIETDPEKTSEWEVRFIAETPSRTRLELEHRHLERHGQGWEGVREGVEGDQAWPLYLKRFAERIAREA